MKKIFIKYKNLNIKKPYARKKLMLTEDKIKIIENIEKKF